MNVEAVIEKIKSRGITLGSAESLTGGLFASTIASIPGVSSFFKGAIVSYSNEVKENVLKVDSYLINQKGVVSSDVAKAMAEGARRVLGVDLAISFTGNAGPNVMEGKPVGLVYIGIYYEGITITIENYFKGSRNEIREQCVMKALEKIDQII